MKRRRPRVKEAPIYTREYLRQRTHTDADADADAHTRARTHTHLMHRQGPCDSGDYDISERGAVQVKHVSSMSAASEATSSANGAIAVTLDSDIRDRAAVQVKHVRIK